MAGGHAAIIVFSTRGVPTRDSARPASFFIASIYALRVVRCLIRLDDCATTEFRRYVSESQHIGDPTMSACVHQHA
jgi:hypothetical protein